jgi:SCP-2 sterol transfer family
MKRGTAMNQNTLNNTFDPKTLADDFLEVCSIYTEFFATLDETRWDKPVKGGPKEWTLHETVAHLCALNGAGLESIKYTLRGEPYTFVGLDTRYQLNAYNRKGIDKHLNLPMKALCAKFLDVLSEAASIARNLQPGQAELTASMVIYNRPVSVVEALSIILVHVGLFHSAQVAEPVGLSPLWLQLSPEIRHRVIGRVMRAFSLLYRFDIGGLLHTTLVFRVGGPGGGEWHVDLAPEAATSSEEVVDQPGLVVCLRDTAVFCQMLTSRLNPPLALIRGDLKLRGDLRLFLRMNTLFSVDARPPGTAKASISSTPKRLTEELFE